MQVYKLCVLEGGLVVFSAMNWDDCEMWRALFMLGLTSVCGEWIHMVGGRVGSSGSRPGLYTFSIVLRNGSRRGSLGRYESFCETHICGTLTRHVAPKH